MSLAAGQTHGNTVGVPSSQQGALLRVQPGAPDASYLIRKLEGGPNISGARMPLSGPALSASDIQRIRDWILAGALDD